MRGGWVGILAVVLLGWAGVAQADFIDHFATSEDIGQAKVPSRGESRILVLTIEVEGFDPLDMDAVRAYFDPEAPASEPSFTRFYEQMSLGAYRPVAEVMEPLRFESCPLPEDYFGYEMCRIPRNGGSGAAALESLEVGIGLLENILQRADDELGVDFARFDVNGIEGEPDGWIDGVLLLHNIRFGGIALPIYFVRRDGPIEHDGTLINIVGIAESQQVSLHEFGHLLGWADLYDESDQTQGLQYSHMGSWGYDSPPPAVDAFSRTMAGWVEPKVFLEGQGEDGVRLRPTGQSGDVVQLGEGEEYFLLENRGAVEGDFIDGDVGGRGLSIIHVNLKRYPRAQDGGWALRLANCANCEPWAPMLMNEQADGDFDLQKSRGRREDSEDLFHPGDDFVPNTINFLPLGPDNMAFSSNRYDGAVTGVSVTNIRFDGDDILVDVKVDAPCSLITCNNGKACEDGRCVGVEMPNNDAPDAGVPDTNDSDTPAVNPIARTEPEGCSTPAATPNPGALLLLGLLLGLGRLRKIR